MKIILAIATALALATTAQAQTQTKKPAAAPRKMVNPTYQQPASSSNWKTGNVSFKHEFDVNLSNGSFESYKVGTTSVSKLNILGSYSYDLGSNFQVGADAGLSLISAGTSTTLLTIAGTVTYNLDADYSNSVFAKAGLGLYPVVKVTGDTKNEFGFYLAAGKRFKLFDHVNYKPAVALQKISDQDVSFIVYFLNISLNF